jgi:hypothetical protein
MSQVFGFTVEATEDGNIEITQDRIIGRMRETESIIIHPMELPLLVSMINDEISDEGMKYGSIK